MMHLVILHNNSGKQMVPMTTKVKVWQHPRPDANSVFSV